MIIGISGLAGSGKDTVADFLMDEGPFVRVALADPMKRICRDVYDFTEEQLWGPSEHRNKPDKRYPRPCTACDGKGDTVVEDPPPGAPALEPCMLCHGEMVTYLSPREALQQLGTEWARNCYPNTWVALTIRTAQTLLAEDCRQQYTQMGGLREVSALQQIKGVVVPDVRYRNEIAAIQAAGGLVFRVRRGETLEGDYALHTSETEQAAIPDEEFDSVIDNRETLLDLKVKVSEIAHQFLK